MKAAMNPSTSPELSDSYAELAELAGQLIHEIKNHLSTLGLNLQLLAEDFQQPETPRDRRALQRVEKLRAQCQRLTDLSNDFLRFARVRDLNLSVCSMKGIIDEIIDFYGPSAAQARIDIKVFLPGNMPHVCVDRDLLKQAILNLVLNAQHAMPEGGELTIQAEPRNGEFLLSFIDTGVGMTPEVMSQIFRPFFSTRAGGSGLGLPTTRKIIEAHGGKIDVQSEPGHGTKFTISLPTAE